MKGRFEEYTKYIDTLNGKVDSVRKNIEDIKETYGDEDLEKDGEFTHCLDNECDYCDNEINGDKNSRG
jgi:archaellum component FlaC